MGKKVPFHSDRRERGPLGTVCQISSLTDTVWSTGRAPLSFQ